MSEMVMTAGIRRDQEWLIGPDFILPSQYCHVRARTKEERLMLAVLEMAVADFQTPRGGRYSAYSLRNNAEAWFRSAESHWPFSFEHICMTLELDADAIRKALGLSGVVSRSGAPLPVARATVSALAPY